MNESSKITFNPWRFRLIILLILLIILGLIARVFDLAVIKKTFLQNQGDARSLRIVTQPAFRGMIKDRNGYPLAISTTVYSAWVNPQEMPSDMAHIKPICQVLMLKPLAVKKLLKQYKDKGREFVYLKRDIPPEVASKMKSLAIPGLYLQQEYKRFYPEGEVAAHVVGFTNVDDKGQEGLELEYDQWLSGTPGKKRVVKDRLGRIISDVQTIQDQKPGNDLMLSLNRRIQYLAYRELMAGVENNDAVSGSVVVLDVKTGEILAMVNQPSFNPNNRPSRKVDVVRNRAVTDVFEPGSTIKAFSVASILDSGRYKTDSVIDTYPGWIRVNHRIVRDEHESGPMTVTQIFQKSSNVGVTKMILSIPPDQLWNLLHGVGFGETTDVGFPGERSGELAKPNTSDPFQLATLAFGYGLSVTTLQLAEAYSVIANHGIKIPLSLIRIDGVPEGSRVMNEKVAETMLTLMESVVSKSGTGVHAQIPGYRVAGKTGTSRIVGANGYEKNHHISSFVGIAPVSQPRFIVAVVIRDPQGKSYLGGDVSAPVFKRIMEGTLHTLNIPPDNPAA